MRTEGRCCPSQSAPTPRKEPMRKNVRCVAALRRHFRRALRLTSHARLHPTTPGMVARLPESSARGGILDCEQLLRTVQSLGRVGGCSFAVGSMATGELYGNRRSDANLRPAFTN